MSLTHALAMQNDCTTGNGDAEALVMKEGHLFWALDKDAAVVQRTYGVLLPQTLLLYNTEEESHVNQQSPVKYFDLQQCLAIQPTDQYQDYFGFILLVVPGGVSLLGCSSEDERQTWIDVINQAIDTEIRSPALLKLIGILQDDTRQPYSSDYNSARSPTPLMNVPKTLNGESFVFSCPPLCLVESPVLESSAEPSPDFEEICGCRGGPLEEASTILEQVRPMLFNSATDDRGTAPDKAKVNGPAKDPPERKNPYIEETEQMIHQAQSLGKMLISQEAANSILEDSCAKLRETLAVLYDKLRQRGVYLEPAFSHASETIVHPNPQRRSSLQDTPGALTSLSFDEASNPIPRVARRHSRRNRRPSQPRPLSMQEEQRHPNELTPSLLSTAASSEQTLIGPIFDAASVETPVDVVCSHCLQTVTIGILEISMNLLTSRTVPSPQTIKRIRASASCLLSYLTGHIAAIRRRTGLPDEVVVTGLAKLVQRDYDASPLVQALIENCAIEVCSQILEEIGGKDKVTLTVMANGVPSDWLNGVPEKEDLKWMLPGYIATCFVLYRLTELGAGKVEDYEKLHEKLVNSKVPDNKIEAMLESLSITLIESLGQLKNNDCGQSESHLQMGLEFESIFHELLASKSGVRSVDILGSEGAHSRSIDANRLFSSKVTSPSDPLALDELRSTFTHGTPTDSAFQSQLTFSPNENHTCDEVESLSEQIRQLTPDERLQNHDGNEALEGLNVDANDYIRVVAALRREFEEDKRRLLEDVKQNWFHRDYYDAFAVESDHTVLLDQVENAINVFSEFVNTAVDNQEGLHADSFNELSGRIPEALGGLAAAANDLRARLYWDPNVTEDYEGEARRIKTNPSPLGFTISLGEKEDPDEISESEI
ncbi:unnamed protein product [Mesocestoides corti]|uniref:PH domain-containing protein n=1 Tax=Mesocestoides corti TaxID=53468 RepID=A0A158QTU3_MESCO|nr:unnamed protein product [Mesocestoides corti]